LPNSLKQGALSGGKKQPTTTTKKTQQKWTKP